MELKLKLKYLGTILFLFLVMIIVDWYKNIDYSYVYNENVKDYIPSEELHLHSKAYQVQADKTYYWFSINTIRKTKAEIPFFYNKEILKSTKPQLTWDPSR